MNFRPCIDLHNGKVVQIVGGSLSSGTEGTSVDDSLEINFTSERGADDFARLYQKDDLTGGHVIALGSGNKEAALSALRAFPGGLQYGGGVTPENAGAFLDAGASHVIVTSYVFSEGRLDFFEVESPGRSSGAGSAGAGFKLSAARWRFLCGDRSLADFY